MIKPLLSIIIASFNTSKITCDCIKSIVADKGLDFTGDPKNLEGKTPAELIIIDNDSKDDSVVEIQKLYDSLNIKNGILIANKENVGFGKANNQGIEIAQGNYILLINSDTIVLHSAISQSLNWLSSHPEANICTAQLLNADKTIQASGGYFPNIANIFTWCFSLDDLPFVNMLVKPFHPHVPQFYTRDKFYLTDHKQDWVTGAFMLIRKSVLDKASYFDTDYFMYGEEVELSYRIKKADPAGETWYLVGPQIIHLGGASAPTKSRPLFQEYLGVLGFFKKHRPFWQYTLVKLFIKANRAIRIIIFTLLGKPQIAALYRNETI